MQAETAPLEVSVVISQKIRKQPSSVVPSSVVFPVIPLLGIYPKDAQSYIQRMLNHATRTNLTIFFLIRVEGILLASLYSFLMDNDGKYFS